MFPTTLNLKNAQKYKNFEIFWVNEAYKLENYKKSHSAHFPKPFLKSFESRSILSTENWIAPTNPKRSNIPKSSERKFLPMVTLLVENAYELRIDKKFSNLTRSYGNFAKWPKYKAIFFVISDSNFELFLASQILSLNKDIFVNETKKIIDLLKILNSKIVVNVAQFLEI